MSIRPSNLPVPTDEAALIGKACRGDHQSFCELVRPYERLLYVTAAAVLRNPDDAEDVAQDAVVNAFLNLSTFRKESKFSTWLVQIAYNAARVRLRKQRRHIHESLDVPVPGKNGDYWPRDFADWRPIPSDMLEQEELRYAIRRAMDSLPSIYRHVLVLRDVHNLSTKDTAAVLGVSEGAVKTRLLRARLQMRDSLAPGIDGSWSQRCSYSKVRPW